MAVVGAILSKNADGDLASATKLVVCEFRHQLFQLNLPFFKRPSLFLMNGLVSGGTVYRSCNRMSCKLLSLTYS